MSPSNDREALITTILDHFNANLSRFRTFDMSADDASAPRLESPATLLARREFAGYELLEEIACGGMGVI